MRELATENPKDWQTHFILATLYAVIEQVEEAKSHLKVILEAQPEHTEAQNGWRAWRVYRKSADTDDPSQAAQPERCVA